MKRLTVGDNSGSSRDGDRFAVIRRSIAGIAVGEEVEVRFKDEFSVTPWRRYRLESADYRDDFDKRRGMIRGVFVRAEGGAA